MSTDADHDDRPVYLNVVTLLDCTPGRADQPGTGEPIAIITFEHKGEIQPPMMLVERDTKKLAVCLLNVLAHHDEPKAKEIMAKFFTHDEEDDGD